MSGLGPRSLCRAVVFALFFGAAFSGELRISVSVEDGASLPGAAVILEGPLSATSSTDSSGNALFSNLPTGGYTVLVSLEGFETVRRRVYLSAEASRDLEFVAKLATVKEEIAVDGSVAILGDAASIDPTTEPGRDLESANCGVNGTGAVAFYTSGPGQTRAKLYHRGDSPSWTVQDVGLGLHSSPNVYCQGPSAAIEVGFLNSGLQKVWRWDPGQQIYVESNPPDSSKAYGNFKIRGKGDTTVAAAYNPAGSLELWRRQGDTWDPLPPFTPRAGVLWDGVFGATENDFDLNDDGDTLFVLHEEVFQTGTIKKVRALSLSGEFKWERTLTSDTRPTGGPGPYTRSAIKYDRSRGSSASVIAFSTNRRTLCNELDILDAETGQPRGKPLITGEGLSSERDNVKRLTCGGGSCWALETGEASVGGTTVGSATIHRIDSRLDRRLARSILDQLKLFSGGLTPPVVKLQDRVGLKLTFEEKSAQKLSTSGSPLPVEANFSAFGFGSLDERPLYLGPAPVVFAQFGDGDGFFSEIVLTNSDSATQAQVTLEFRDSDGVGLPLDLDGDRVTIPGSTFQGGVTLTIPPAGTVALQTDASGELVQGSVVANSLGGSVSGVVVFGGSFGLAGVGASPLFTNGFSAPMETRSEPLVNTGVAIANLQGEDRIHSFQLLDKAGTPLASAVLAIPAWGQRALFVDQFDWDASVDFSNFEGTLYMQTGGLTAATAIQLRPGQFATLPVRPLQLP